MSEAGTWKRLSPEEADTVEAVADFHQAHHDKTGRRHRVVATLTGALARPVSLAVLVLSVGVALLMGWLAGAAAFSSTIVAVELVAAVAALVVAVMILITQTRENELAVRREQLTLELALLSDRKNAKIISLLQDLRRDAPGLRARPDAESDAMAAPADLRAVANAIDETDAS